MIQDLVRKYQFYTNESSHWIWKVIYWRPAWFLTDWQLLIINLWEDRARKYVFYARLFAQCGGFDSALKWKHYFPDVDEHRGGFHFISPHLFFSFHCRNLVNIHFNQQRKYNLSIFIGRLPKVYWNRNVECMHFPPERVCISRDKATCRSKSVPSMVADEMQTQSNQSGRYHNPALKCQSPLSSLCVWWEIIVWENLLILANTLSALICTERIRLY